MYQRVLVFYPRGVQTGGPEALHQLVDSLRRQGVEAALVPYPKTRQNARVELYEQYDAPEIENIRDIKGTAIVAGEREYPSLLKIQHADPICWWLSIDLSYLFSGSRRVFARHYDAPPDAYSRARDSAARLRAIYRQRANGDRITHVTQSHYAWAYIFDRMLAPPSMLSDYTPRLTEVGSYSRPRNARGGIAYNAVKSRHLVSQLSQRFPKGTFIPIENMSQDEVYSVLGRASVYLDLGAHPGKDRIPREAAMAGCIVSVGLRGSAGNSLDMSIPFAHKIDLSKDPLNRAQEVLNSIEDDRETAFARQAAYRHGISNERAIFDAEVRAIFIRGLRGFDTVEPFPSPTVKGDTT